MPSEFAEVPPQIFISYTGRDDVSKTTASALFDELTRAGFAVYFDQALLEEGEQWRPELDRALFECDGGVVLLSKSAIQSGWVKKEATILRSRRSLDDSFVFLPVFVGGAKPGDLVEYDWEPIDLDSIQGLKSPRDDQVPGRVVEFLRRRFEDWPDKSADKRRQRLMTQAIAKVERAELANLLGRLPREYGDWMVLNNPQRALARKLASRFADTPAKEVARYARPIHRSMQRNQADLLVKLAAVHWVPREMAQQLAEEGESARARILADPSGDDVVTPLVAVDADEADAAQMCVHRATGHLDDWHYVAVANRHGEQAFDELEAEILKALDEELLIGERELEEPNESMLPLVIAIPNRVAPDDVPKLRRRFRCATLMLCDPRLSGSPEAQSTPGTCYLAPLEGAADAVESRAKACQLVKKYYED